ncbi:hypothetical protein HDU78_006253 [Chytriomyces hyalinus]|nr:hypothetical protein HDU78_006253 [Chytriomyces hyalinus]
MVKAIAKNDDTFSEYVESNTYDDEALPSLNSGTYFELLKAEAESGDVHSKFVLGMLYLNGGNQTPRDPAKALSWLVRAHVGGFSHATLKLGDLYFEGTDYLKDYEKATSYYLVLMRNENTLLRGDNTLSLKMETQVLSFTWLVVMSEGTDKNKALSLYEKASLQGHRQAAAVLRQLKSSGSMTDVKPFPVGSDSDINISPPQLQSATSGSEVLPSTSPRLDSSAVNPDTSAGEEMPFLLSDNSPKIAPNNRSQMQNPQFYSNGGDKGLAAQYFMESSFGRSLASKALPAASPVELPNTQGSSALKGKVVSKKKKRRK